MLFILLSRYMLQAFKHCPCVSVVQHGQDRERGVSTGEYKLKNKKLFIGTDLPNISTHRNTDDFVLRRKISYVTVAWLFKEKRHMKLLFTRHNGKKSSAAFNLFEDLSYYHAFWHIKVASCVIFTWQIA